MSIHGNRSLLRLDALSNLTSVPEVYIQGNDQLRDCPVCALLHQLTSPPASVTVTGNLADSCTPVPAGCTE